jgi:hypothetical protein
MGRTDGQTGMAICVASLLPVFQMCGAGQHFDVCPIVLGAVPTVRSHTAAAKTLIKTLSLSAADAIGLVP